MAKHRPRLIIIVLLAALLAAVVFLPSLTQQQPRDEPTQEQILAKLYEKGVAGAGTPAITKLANVEELRKSSPVIYKDAKNGQYEVRWPTLFVIYDYESDLVVNDLSITRVELQ